MHPAYDALYTSDRRYFLLTGGRASLKSSNTHEFIANLCHFQPGHGVLFTRYTMTSAEKSIIPEFTETLIKLGIAHEFHITKNRVTHKNGSFIHFSGIKVNSKDQTGALKSLFGIDTWVIEEGEDFDDEKAFDKIDDSIRTTTHQNRVIWIQNPTTREHFIYKRFVEPKPKTIQVEGFDVTVSGLPNVEHIHTTYHIAEELGYLNSTFLDKANDWRQKLQIKIEETARSWTKTPKELENKIYEIRQRHYYYTNYVGGWLERNEDAVFKSWKIGAFDHTLPYCYGLDFGYFPDPLAMTKVAIHERVKKLYLKEIIYQTEIDDVPGLLNARGIRKRDLIVCDTNESRTTANIKKARFNIVKAAKGKGSIVDDIREMNEYEIIVGFESPNLTTELNNYTWNDKKASIPIDEFNHLIDGGRYGYRRLKSGGKKGVRRKN